MHIDIDHLRSWIGRTEEQEDVVTSRLAAEFRATLSPHLAPDNPPGLHWCLVPSGTPTPDLAADGHPPKGGFLPPVPLPRRMWAGGAVETRGRFIEGAPVTRRSRIADVSLKGGRTGPLCFVIVEHDFLSENRLVLRDRHDIVYRGENAGEAKASPSAPLAPAKAEMSWSVDASPVLLFRYSAITFNGHRIHYDHPYVTQTEGYDGLVVHGPLQATLMFNLAAVMLGATPEHFSYRGLAPLTAGAPFTVNGARREDGTVDCWTADATGRTCMKAIALRLV